MHGWLNIVYPADSYYLMYTQYSLRVPCPLLFIRPWYHLIVNAYVLLKFSLKWAWSWCPNLCVCFNCFCSSLTGAEGCVSLCGDWVPRVSEENCHSLWSTAVLEWGNQCAISVSIVVLCPYLTYLQMVHYHTELTFSEYNFWIYIHVGKIWRVLFGEWAIWTDLAFLIWCLRRGYYSNDVASTGKL